MFLTAQTFDSYHKKIFKHKICYNKTQFCGDFKKGHLDSTGYIYKNNMTIFRAQCLQLIRNYTLCIYLKMKNVSYQLKKVQGHT